MKTYILKLNLMEYTPNMVRKFHKEEVERFFDRREFEILTSIVGENAVWELRFKEQYDGHLANTLLLNDNLIIEHAHIIEEI